MAVGTTSHHPAAEAVREQVQRILKSPGFVRSERLKELLHWTVEETLSGRGNEIKEYAIGLTVFGRKDSFDPKLDSIVRVTVSKLRLKLKEYYSETGQSDPVQIEYPPSGYMPVFRDRLASAIPETSKLTPTKPPTMRRVWIVTAGIATLILGLGIAASFTYTKWRAPAGNRVSSVAVLPFVNLTGDEDFEYLGDGLTEEVIDSLSKVPGVQVIARTSAFQFKGKMRDVREIGAQLGVSAVLEGSVRKSGSRFRITVQLNKVSDGYHLWSQTYDRERNDLLDLQADIAQEVAGAFPIGRRKTPVPEAYELYLKGRHFSGQLGRNAVRQAIPYFEKAIAVDPQFAAAYAGLADSFFSQTVVTSTVPPAESLAKVKTLAARSIELDPTSSEAHVTMGRLKGELEWDWQGAIAEFRRAIELAPGAQRPHRRLGDLLSRIGRSDEGLRELRKALQIDPLSADAGAILTRGLCFASQFDAAVKQGKSTIELHPSHFPSRIFLAYAHEGRRDYNSAIEFYLRAQELSRGQAGPGLTADLVHVYAVSGKRQEARKLLADLLEHKRTAYVLPMIMAKAYLGFGETGQVFAHLEEGYTQKDPWMLWLKTDFRFNPIRKDPSYEALLRKMGL